MRYILAAAVLVATGYIAAIAWASYKTVQADPHGWRE